MPAQQHMCIAKGIFRGSGKAAQQSADRQPGLFCQPTISSFYVSGYESKNLNKPISMHALQFRLGKTLSKTLVIQPVLKLVPYRWFSKESSLRLGTKPAFVFYPFVAAVFFSGK